MEITESASRSTSVPKGKLRLLLISTAIALSCSLHFGYQATSVNPSETVFRDFVNGSFFKHYGSYLTQEQYAIAWGVLTGVSLFGDFVGMVLLVPISEKLGRKRGLYLATTLLCVAYVTEATSKWLNTFELFGVGRFLRGVSQGWAIDIQSMFFSEISPVRWRGVCGGVTEVFVQVGMILGGLLSLPEIFGTRELWPFLFLIECVPTLVTWMTLFWVHESPKYLMARGHIDKAEKALAFYQHEDVKDSLQHISDEVQHQEIPPTILQLFKEKHLRLGLLLGILVWFISTFSGNIAMEFFSTHLLINVGVQARTARFISIGLSCQSLVAVLLSSFIVDHVGRRPLILGTAAGLVTANILLMVFSLLYSTYGYNWLGYACVGALFLLIFLYGVGPAVLRWTVMSEVVPQNARSIAIAVSNGINILLATINQVAFFPLNYAAGGYSFLLYVIPLAVFTVVVYFVFPETKQRNTSHIVHSLKQSETFKTLRKESTNVVSVISMNDR